MKALVWHGKEDVRYDTVSDPEIENPRDAITKVTSCAICGSDLHLFHNLIPAMLPGDVLGHETMGEVVEVGSAARDSLSVGDRVVIPFTIQCGECEQCVRGNSSVCRRSNRKGEPGDKAFGHRTAGPFGYTHLTGGYPGGQAEYLQVPSAWPPASPAMRSISARSPWRFVRTTRSGTMRRSRPLVVGITLLDLFAYTRVKAVHSRERGSGRDYSDRGGLPRGARASRGLARRDFDPPPDYRAEGTVADALPELVA